MNNNSCAIQKGDLKVSRFIIPFRVYGTRGQQILCLNGIQQSMAMWLSFIRRFSDSYRIIIFDFPNQGKAKILSGPAQVTLQEQEEIIGALIKKLDLGNNLTMCAASWGGVVAASFSVKYPQKVKRLILASLSTKPNKKMIETIKNGSQIDPKNRKEMAKTLIDSFGQNLPEKIKKKISEQFVNMSKERLQTFYEHGLSVISTKEIGEVVDLSKIKAQTILVNGEKDAIIDLEDVKYLASKIPDCKMYLIKNVGHFLHMEDDKVLDTYEKILNKWFSR